MDAVVKELHHKATTFLATPSLHPDDHQLGVQVSTTKHTMRVGLSFPLLLYLLRPMLLVGLFPQTVLITSKPKEDSWGDQNQENFLVSK
jgi:hypothetical protein